MAEVLFLWFGMVAGIYAFDLWDRESSFSLAVGMISVMSIGYYIVSVITLP